MKHKEYHIVFLLFAVLASLYSGCGSDGNSGESKSNLSESAPIPNPMMGAMKCANFNKSTNASYPIFKGSGSVQALEKFGEKLAHRFLSIDAPTSSTEDEITYQQGKKSLIIDKRKLEIKYIDSVDVGSQNDLNEGEVIESARQFIKDYPELGTVKDYYLNSLVAGNLNQSFDGVHETPATWEAPSVIIKREVQSLPVLGGVSSVRLEVANSHDIVKFKIKFVHLSEPMGSVSDRDFMLPDQAEERAKKIYRDLYQEDVQQSWCELGYIPNAVDSVPDVVAPGYMFTFSSQKDGKRHTILLPAMKDKSFYDAHYASMNATGE